MGFCFCPTNCHVRYRLRVISFQCDRDPGAVYGSGAWLCASDNLVKPDHIVHTRVSNTHIHTHDTCVDCMHTRADGALLAFSPPIAYVGSPAAPQDTSHLTAPFSKKPAYTTIFGH